MKRAENRPELGLLLKKAKKRDAHALGRLLSEVEKDLAKASKFLATVEAKSQSVRIGITGPPGAGKSSLIKLLIRTWRSERKSVAVIAVDPSSPFSGGALLGDRVRMGDHSSDPEVFIRSIGSRGGFGGLSAATGAMATVLEGANFDVIIIETVGVGQTELQVMNLADVTSVVLVPESGDVIQTLKAGILEVADLFVVNKSDRPEADVLAKELAALAEIEQSPRTTLMTSATQETGIQELATTLLTMAGDLKILRRADPVRMRAELQNLFLWETDKRLKAKLAKIKVSGVYSAFAKLK